MIKCSSGTDFDAGSIGAMHAGPAGEYPLDPTVFIAAYLVEFDLNPGIGREVWGILIGSTVCGGLSFQPPPLLAGYLATPAGSAFA